MKDARGNKKTNRPTTAGSKPGMKPGTRMRKLLDEMHDREDSAKRAEEILALIRSRKLPTLEDTLSEAQHTRLKPLAWLINDQEYTTQEILLVTTINEQRLGDLEAGDREFSRQRANRTNNKTTQRRK